MESRELKLLRALRLTSAVSLSLLTLTGTAYAGGGCWANFSAGAMPNGCQCPDWAPYPKLVNHNIHFDTPNSSVDKDKLFCARFPDVDIQGCGIVYYQGPVADPVCTPSPTPTAVPTPEPTAPPPPTAGPVGTGVPVTAPPTTTPAPPFATGACGIPTAGPSMPPTPWPTPGPDDYHYKGDGVNFTPEDLDSVH